MIDINTKPIIRSEIEIIPAHDNEKNQTFVILQDKEGLTNKSVIMPFETIVILQMLNGENSIKDIQTTIMKETGTLLSESELIHLVNELDNTYFLENERTQQLRKQLYEEFKNSTIRKPVHKGLSYPENILDLSLFLSKFLKIENKIPIKSTTAAISPHIDFIRGGNSYGKIYEELSNSIKPDLVIAFGTSHRGGNSPFIITKKSYETPYGNIETDMETYNKIKEILWYEPDEEEYYHKNEHSLEFQAIWLKYIWRENTPKWISILTSSFERFATDIPPSKIDTMEKLFKDFENLLKEISKDKKILILAGADLSHVGPRFGDNLEINLQLKKEIEEKDKEKIKYILDLDADGFYMSIMKEKNQTHICGISAIYCLLRAIRAIKPDSKPKLLDYSQADDPIGGFVSFTAISF